MHWKPMVKLIVQMKRPRVPRRCFREDEGHFPSNIGSRRGGFDRRYDFVGRERDRDKKKYW